MFYTDTIESTQRNSDQELFFLTIESIPEKNNPSYYENDYDGDPDELVGAYVNCYIHVDSLQQAEQTALNHIVKSGWRPIAFHHWSILDGQQYRESNHPEWKEERDYVTGAFSVGAAYVYHIFSEEAEEEEEEETGEWIRFAYEKNEEAAQ